MGKKKDEQVEANDVSSKTTDSEDNQAVAVLTERRWTKARVLIIFATLLLVTGVVGGAIWLTRHRVNQTDKAKPTAVTETKEYQQARTSTDKLRGSQDYDAAKKVWQSYIDTDASDEEKYKAYLQIGALDDTKGDCKAALKSYYMAEKLGDRKWRAENEAIARCSEKLGDLPTALTYYQRTLDTFPGGEEYDSDLRYYRNKIDSLKRALETKQNG